VTATASLGEVERQLRRVRDAVDRGDVEAALAIIGGRYTDAVSDLMVDLVKWAQLHDVTVERVGILLGMPADSIYNALREGKL
jgi:hypothetical protein